MLQDIQHLVRQGKTIREISDELQIHYQTVYGIVKRHNLNPTKGIFGGRPEGVRNRKPRIDKGIKKGKRKILGGFELSTEPTEHATFTGLYTPSAEQLTLEINNESERLYQNHIRQINNNVANNDTIQIAR